MGPSFKRFCIIVYAILYWPFYAFGYLQIGDKIKIGKDQYEITQTLGKGGSKNTYKAQKVKCKINCDVVIGVIHPPDKLLEHYDFSLLDKINASPSIHLRREYFMVKTKIKKLPGSTYVAVMEYGAGNLHDAQDLSKVSLRLLMEDAYLAIHAMRDAQVINTDIKTANMIIMGPDLSDQSIKAGKSYLSIGDHDFLYKEGHKVQSLGATPGYMPPEFYIYDHVLDYKSSLWQISASFYEKLTKEPVISSTSNILDLLGNFSLRQSERENAQKLFDTRRNEIRTKLDEIINQHLMKGEHEEVAAMKEIKTFILNGLQLDPDKREFWPYGMKKLSRPIPPPTHRMAIAPELSIRNLGQVESKEVTKLYENATKLGRFDNIKDGPHCSILDKIKAVERQLATTKFP